MKNGYFKRISTLLLAVAMLLSSVPMRVFAQEETLYDTSLEQELESIEEETDIQVSTEATEPGPAVQISSAAALEEALAAGAERICITADFEIDRTFYISHNVTIFSEQAHTLTRAADFAGDIFVVGEAADGTACVEPVKLSVGTAGAENSDMLVINGNKENMTVTVTGTVFFACANSRVDLYPDLTVQNCEKKGNVRTLDKEKYGLCSDRKIVGGAVGITCTDSVMNIYGGKYLNNGVSGTGTYGGAFFNYSTLKVHDGLFEGGYASRAGAFYNYRTMYIYKAQIRNNTATSMGGAIYLPSSTGAILHILGDATAQEAQIVFANNTAKIGGAISTSGKIAMHNVLLESNSATETAGAIYANGQYINVSVYGCQFKGNEAGTEGGAIYIADQRPSHAVDLDVRDSHFTQNLSGTIGGAIYLGYPARAYVRDTEFSKNEATDNGGAVYVLGATAEFNHVTFTENTAEGSGGAIAMTKATEEATQEAHPAAVIMNQVTATGNSTATNGGVIFSGSASLNVYNSTFKENTAKAGSAFYFSTDAVADLYNSTIEGNSCLESNTGNAGAVAIVTGGTKVTMHTCTLKNNTSSGYGGGILVTSSSLVDLFQVTATGNSAAKGGFMYETKAGTIVTISGLTVSGNTATAGGPIIWGNTTNAKLYINKSNYTDLDVTTELDDAYWATAIVNKLTTADSDAAVPQHGDYTQPIFDDTATPNVKTAKQLENAIKAGIQKICILESFEIDRTFYITTNIEIYSETPVTLTRAKGFAGDVFVVGEAADGTPCEGTVTLTLGTAGTGKSNMLVIDGNKDAMEEKVTGTVFFACRNARIDLQADVSVLNCVKKGNDRTLEEQHGVSNYPKYVGGAVAIVAEGARMNIYGGNYSGNGASMSGVSSYGGAFFNHGTMRVYGGTFNDNSAYRGGSFYNYRTMYLDGAVIENNSASVGGAIYVPSSTGAFLYVGTAEEAEVILRGNHATGNGGAIYGSGRITLENTTFESNQAGGSGGAVYIAGNYKTLTAKQVSFLKNRAAENGSAIYLSGASNYAERFVLHAEKVTFSENVATGNGAVYLYETGAYLKDAAFDKNSAATGAAIYATAALLDMDVANFAENTATGNGGALALQETTEAEMNNVTATGNAAAGVGGFAIVEKSAIKVHSSKLTGNSAASAGAIAAAEGCQAGIYNTEFKQNTATEGNGGAMDIYTGGQNVQIHSCTFLENTAAGFGGAMRVASGAQVKLYQLTVTANAAKKGGFLYETGAGSVVTLNGITVSGNTAAAAGGAIIWGDTLDAVLNIDKRNYVDADLTTKPDASYWASAIANALTVKEINEVVPPALEYGNEEPGGMWNATDVDSADALAAALAAGIKEIRITKSLALDRTFYITRDTVIFSTARITLTRAPGFGGDIFVVGQAEDGTPCAEEVSLTVGIPTSKTKNLLVLDGSKQTMTVEVVGTVFFVCANGHVDLYENLTVKNFKKTGNARTLESVHGVSYPEYIGAAVGILAKNASMNIYGGTYSQNAGNETGKSSYGGAFYNFGTLNVYGGLFQGNRANRAGVFYNYRTLNLYNARLEDNHASTSGGAIYMPASTGAFLYVGKTYDGITGSVHFEGNTAEDNGGAIYANHVAEIENATFRENEAENGGAIAAYSLKLTVTNSSFISNTAAGSGGAVYIKGETSASITDCSFSQNKAKANARKAGYGGGALFANNTALDVTGTSFHSNSSLYDGGAIVLTAGTKAVLKDITADGNTAENSGAFLYAADVNLNMSDSKVRNGVAKNNGGAIALEAGAQAMVVKTDFEANKATVNGGAVYAAIENSEVFFHSCTFTGNSGAKGGAVMAEGGSSLRLYNTIARQNSATYGGVVYLSGNSTKADINGMTVAGNQAATEGTLIYSNSAEAALEINKKNVTDEEVATELDEAYWSQALGGALKVTENDDRVPGYAEIGNESFGYLWPAVDVASADALAAALAAGEKYIRVVADFTLDRTFTVRSDAVLFSTKVHTLTRAADFGGVIFTVASGMTFGIGNSSSATEHLLTVNGNKDNMTVAVTGPVLEVKAGAKAELFQNLTLTGCSVTPLVINGTLTVAGGNYTGNTTEADGALVICDGTVQIRGGMFTKNTATANGGILLNRGTAQISGGTFTSNKAVNGGVVYNQGSLEVSGGTFVSNTVTEKGGAVYNLGDLQLKGGSFERNGAASGGAVYNQSEMTVSAAVFTQNKATANGGAIASEKDFGVTGGTFTANTAASNGGAVYVVAANPGETKLIVIGAVFAGNKATLGGAIAAKKANLVVTADFEANSATHGGAVYLDAESDGTFAGVTATFDTASKNGGFLYCKRAAASISDSHVISATAKLSGGAIFVDSGKLSVVSSDFTQTIAGENGGAICLSGASGTAEIENCAFKKTSTEDYGGAIYKNGEGRLTVRKCSFEACGAGIGGAVCARDGELIAVETTFASNTASGNGGAVALMDGAVSTFTRCTFQKNTAGANGGAVCAETDVTKTVMEGTTFASNTASGNGGAVYAGGFGNVELYDTTATKNAAKYGGVLYLATISTDVTVSGMTVSGNAATASGKIIYGNSPKATLRIDKTNFVDQDESGSLDNAYWKKAIAGSLEIATPSASDPGFGEGAVDVFSAAALERALKSGKKLIRITADFPVDRTFFITSDVTIFSDEPHTLTRAANFGGDFFVVGENADGQKAHLNNKSVRLTVGNPNSKEENLLIFDGNIKYMKTMVVGSIFFITYGADVDLYDNVTVQNCYKQGNERAMTGYKLSRPNRIGGSVAIIANGVLTIYGGNYRNNKVNIEDSTTEEGRNSSIGGVFYNDGNLIIRGGTFEGNEGARGAIVYNYQNVKIVAGTFINNHATKHAAIYYAPSSPATQLVIGSTGEGMEKVLIKDNSAINTAGAIYSSHFSAVVVLGNTVFKNNSTKKDGGAIYVIGALTVKNTEFIGNTAVNNGGALYLSRGNNDHITRLVTIENCIFKENQAKYGGAMATNSSAAKSYGKGSIVTVSNSLFQSNKATSGGGAVYATNSSVLTMEGNTFLKNRSSGEAGAMYLIGKSEITLQNNVFDRNEADSHGGALSVRSAWVTMNGDQFLGNISSKNGGAMYLAYSSDQDINSHVTMSGVIARNNRASSGGAIYLTRRAIEENAVLLNVKDTTFEKNSAKGNGGAILISGGAKTYFNDVDFKENTASSNGGAVQVGSNGLFELDKATFAGNTGKIGGAVALSSGGTAVMNNITATKNAATSYGGFLYSEGGVLKLYDSTVSENSGYSGGAMYLFTGAESSVYNTAFSKNTTFRSENGSTGNGGAVFIYTGKVETVLHSCSFVNNETTGTGGALYISGSSRVKMFNISAAKNKATKGGFLYETKAETVVDIVGLTVSQNSATDGGSIIWGNTVNAKLNLDKAKYTDTQTTTLDDAYWQTAIEGLLTVTNTAAEVTDYDPYAGKTEPPKTPVEKQPVLVDDVFNLAQNSSDANINKYYNKLPKLDNSSNLMSRSTKDFPNINGKTVTVDTYVYSTNGKADNGIVGLALMIFQTLEYKKMYPDEEVYIDIASYRFSVQAGININRNSRYFGYERNLVGKNYDEYGFVRLSYLLITAAKMGIHVVVTGQQDGYPISASNYNFYDYFTTQLADPCDPRYADGKVIGDYLDFNFCYWTLDAKGGTDMMHNKMCAVSHYLDKDGVVHRNAVWSSSSNLDGVKPDGRNANWKQQTASIITNHDELYRVATNYMRLIAGLCEQEGVIEFQDAMNTRSTEQIDLIRAGRGHEIPADEQIVYIGTPEDDVFELYFTPFGGGRLAWDEIHNPYCKYLREMYESEDYILFTWNAAEYSGGYVLGTMMEDMIIRSFHENRNVKNKIFSHMESFDASTFDDLVVGKDIGYKSFFERPFGKVHNKDVQLSYVKDGQRYFVTLLNSLNVHSGSMYYQANFLLVVKETSCDENGVFSTIARLTTTGDIAAHEYGQVQTVKATAQTHGYTYRKCLHCDDTVIVDAALHYPGEWVVDMEPTETKNGLRHKSCTVCGDLMESQEILRKGGTLDMTALTGKQFTATSAVEVETNAVPLTVEAKISLPKHESGRTGVILGNYSTSRKAILNLEGDTNGRLKLYIKNGEKVFRHTFAKDLRSDKPVDIAVTFASGKATLYVNGEKAESVTLGVALPGKLSGLKIGGDNRTDNTQYFKGTVYAVHLFSTVRTSAQMKKDRAFVSPDASGLLFSRYFTAENGKAPTTTTLSSKTFTAKKLNKLSGSLSAAPKTIEATIFLSKNVKDRGGVIFGNYNETFKSPLNLEIYTGGRVRLYFKSGGEAVSHIFKTDVRTESGTVHIAVTLSGKTATLYVNGEKVETAKLKAAAPGATKQFCIGGDNREGNTQYFKGKIYNVAVFSDVRTASEIKRDAKVVPSNTGNLVYSAYITGNTGKKAALHAQTFSADVTYKLKNALSATPKTIEATIMLPTSVTGRGGVIFGNYQGNTENPLNLEIYTGGRIRLYYKSGGETVSHIFQTDVRTKVSAVHIAITLSGTTATLYINGEKKETAKLKAAVPETTEQFCVGGDNREGNVQYFRGKIYSVNVFSDVRTPAEIKKDAVVVTTAAKDVLFSGYFHDGVCGVTNVGAEHTQSQWVVKHNATATEGGVKQKVCTCCGEILAVAEIMKTENTLQAVNYAGSAGKTFSKKSGPLAMGSTLNGNGFTVETLIQLSPEKSERAGTLLGNYQGDKSDQFNLEVYTDGKVRLYYMVDGTAYTHIFAPDIRGDKKTHIALTVSGVNVALYVDGQLAETYTASKPLPTTISNLKIGGDNKSNDRCFIGKMYSMYLFDEVRSAEEVARDAIMVLPDTSVIYGKLY